MKILDRLPVFDKHYQFDIHGEPLKIRPFQILIQVSLSDIPTWDPRTPLIPALLDTGNNHNRSIWVPGGWAHQFDHKPMAGKRLKARGRIFRL